jgi:hypothetical protein
MMKLGQLLKLTMLCTSPVATVFPASSLVLVCLALSDAVPI